MSRLSASESSSGRNGDEFSEGSNPRGDTGSPPTDRRGQTEPLAALVAVFAVCIGVTLYVGVYAETTPDRTDRTLAEPALDEAMAALADDGTVGPERLDNRTIDLQFSEGEERSETGPSDEPDGTASIAPKGYQYNVTVVLREIRWSIGPTPPPDADHAERRVPVEHSPGRIESGRLIVEVWT